MVSEARHGIVFIGGRQHGYALLERLLAEGYDVARIFALREDDHEPLRFDVRIEALARDAGIRCSLRKRLSSADVAEVVAMAPELAIVFGWRTILPPALICAPRLGCVGVHDSLLPRYRGFAPTNWAIINGERTTGVTLWYLDDAVDSGDIIAQSEIAIGPDDTAADVYARVAPAAVELILQHLPQVLAGTAPRRAQDGRDATYTCARTPADGEIDWTRSSAEVAGRVRALTRPYPGAFTFFEGRRIRVWSARDLPEAPAYAGRIAGRVVKLVAGSGVDVLCGSGIVRIGELETADGDVCRADELIRSVRVTLGRDPDALARRVESLEAEVARLRAIVERASLAGAHR